MARLKRKPRSRDNVARNGDDVPPVVQRLLDKKARKPKATDDDDDESDEDEDVEESEHVVTRQPKVPQKSVRMPASTPIGKPSRSLEPSTNKKLTKKQKLTLDLWKGDSAGRARDTYFQAQAEAARKKFNTGGIFAGSEVNALTIGIPMPSIALEWLILQEVFPLSVMIMLVGRWRTNKSAFLYEIFRWFAKFNGGAILMENETKFSPDLCASIMGFAQDECPLIVSRCNSLEDWQEKFTYFLKDQKKRMTGTQEEPGPGRRIPICFAVDSIMGKSAREKQEKVQAEGSANRAFPVEALKITEFLKATAHQFDNWPFAFVGVNHLKKDITAEPGESSRRVSGGDHVGFQESIELETSVWKSKIDTSQFDGVGIKLSCAKNSLARTGNSIKTRMLWWDEVVGEDESGVPIYAQKTVWDWDWATVKFLSEVDTKYKKRFKEFDFVLDVQSPTADMECLARSRALGMGKDEWLSWHEVGELIRTNSDLMNRLRRALGIKRGAILDGDYHDQLTRLARKQP